MSDFISRASFRLGASKDGITIMSIRSNKASFGKMKTDILIPSPRRLFQDLRFRIGYAIVPRINTNDWTNVSVVIKNKKAKLSLSGKPYVTKTLIRDDVFIDDEAWGEE